MRCIAAVVLLPYFEHAIVLTYIEIEWQVKVHGQKHVQGQVKTAVLLLSVSELTWAESSGWVGGIHT